MPLLPFTLSSAVPRPDGPVALRLDLSRLPRPDGTPGAVDPHSLLVADRDLFQTFWDPVAAVRPVPTQFLPDADYDPITHPVGTLLFRLHNHSWELERFPRQFELQYEFVKGGGCDPATRRIERKWLPRPVDLSIRPGRQSLEMVSPDAGRVLAYSYQYGEKPHFHPLTTPTGRLLTADSPRDHLWHHGLNIGYTYIKCPSKNLPPYVFWGEPACGFLHAGVPLGWSGQVASGFEHEMLFCSQQGEPIMRYGLKASYSAIEKRWNWLDLEVTLSACDAPIEVETPYGHLKARMSLEFQNAAVLDSTAEPFDSKFRDKRLVDWIAFTGELAGGPAGLLMLNHPDNPGGQPSGDRACDLIEGRILDEGDLFGWIGLNPFRDTSTPIAVGQSLTYRYRIVLCDRGITPKFAEIHHRNFITPWEVGGLPTV